MGVLKRFFPKAAVRLLLLGLLPLRPLLLYAQNGGSISGHVTNSINGAGIEGARVRVCPSAGRMTRCGNTSYQAVTDTTGAFRIAGIPDGRYVVPQVGLAKDGLTPTFALKAGPLPSVTLSGDSRIDLQMTPFAKVDGRVFDPEGKPAAGIAVKLGMLPGKVTGENGEFVFEAVRPSSWMTLSATPRPQAAAKDGTRIVTTYYPSVVDSDRAAPIVVMGVDLSYDIRLQTARARAIRGVVIGADGKPAAGARVAIVRTEPGMVWFVRADGIGLPKVVEAALPLVSKEDGTFAFPPVIEGEWMVRASFLSRGMVSNGATSVVVSTHDADEGDVQNIEIHLAQPFDVEVTADWGDSPPANIPRGFAFASFIPLDSQGGLQGLMRPEAEPGKPQRFRLSRGMYFIWEGETPTFAPVSGFYSAAAMLDGRDVLGQVVEVSGPASLKVIYKTAGGSVRGTVERGADGVVVLMADGTPAAGLGYAGRCDEKRGILYS